MIKQANSLTRLPNEWYDCGQESIIPFISWKAIWPPCSSDAVFDHLKTFCSSLFHQEIPEHREHLLTVSALSIVRYLYIGNSNAFEQWHAQLTIPENGFRFIYPFIDEFVAVEYGKAAYAILCALINRLENGRESFQRNAEQLTGNAKKRLDELSIKDSSARFLIEATKRGIPVGRISPFMPFYLFGNGCRQKRIWRGFTSGTSHIGTIVSTHKHITSRLLGDMGFPVAKQYLVNDIETASRAAAELGYPVVVKPSNTDYGTGVTTGITDDMTLRRSFSSALNHGSSVIIEKHIEGDDHRLTVIDGKCLCTEKRIPAHIIGNGSDTVESLIRQMAKKRGEDPFFRNFRSATLEDPQVADALRKNNIRPESIPEKGRMIQLRTNANVSTGGTSHIVTADTHPDNLRLAERAASCIGLDIAGIDLITTDISKSWRETGGCICEVNATPMVRPGFENNLFDYLFPDGSNGRVPLLVIVGDEPETEPIMKTIISSAESKNIVAGYVCSSYAAIGRDIITEKHAEVSGFLKMVLADKATELAVAAITPSEVRAKGLSAGYCSLAIFCTDDNEVQNLTASPLSVLAKAAITLIRPKEEVVFMHMENLLKQKTDT